MQRTEAILYGRRALVAVAALISIGIQTHHAGPIVVTVSCVAIQIAALGFCGAPGSFAWMLLSRQPEKFPNRREWNGAMHGFVAATIALSISVDAIQSPLFLGCSGAFLLLAYGSSKLGCHRLGCCGWSFDRGAVQPFRRISRRVELPLLEAALSFAGGLVAIAATLFSIDSTIVFLAAIAFHMGLRQLFDAVRSRRGLAAKAERSITSLSQQDRIGTTDPDLD